MPPTSLTSPSRWPEPPRSASPRPPSSSTAATSPSQPFADPYQGTSTTRSSRRTPPQEAKGHGRHGGALHPGPLNDAIIHDFGNLDALEFNAATAGIHGSGWGWLRLEVVTTANQDPLLSHIPIIGVDIWEHAFYLQCKNVKVDFVVDCKETEARFEANLVRL